MSIMPLGHDPSMRKKSNMREGAKVFFIASTIVLVIALFITTIFNSVGSTDTGSDCFVPYKNVYSWNYRTAELDEIWKDRKITLRECKLVKSIGSDIDVEQGRRELDAAVKEYRVQSK